MYGFITLFIALLIAPIIVECLVNIPVPSIANEQTWIGFYGGLLGSLFGAFALIFITLYQINKNKQLEIYNEDIKDIAYLKMIEQFVEASGYAIFSKLLSPILENYRRFKQNKNLTIQDLNTYFLDMMHQSQSCISIKDEYKCFNSLEDIGLGDFFENKNLFNIESLLIKEKFFIVEEKHYEWASHLNTEVLINDYFKALSSIEQIRKEFSRNNDGIIDKVSSIILDSYTFKILDNKNSEYIKDQAKKTYIKMTIGDRFIMFFLCFDIHKDLSNLSALIRNEINQKSERIKSYKSF